MSTNAEDTKKDLKQKGRVENASPPAPPPRLVEPIEYGPPRPIAQLLPVLNLENLPLYKNAPVKTKGPESTDDLSPIALNNDETEKLQISSTIENQLKKILPAGYQLNCTPNNYDSWWESVACYLNHLIGSNKSFSVESLRLLVSDIVKNEKNRPDWFTPDLLLEYGYTEGLYLARISESVAQMKEHNRRLTLIGDAMPGSDIEARLLCTKFPITIHCIEIADDGEFRETITNSESTDEIEPLNREDYINENNMVHLVVYKNHVMPLINYHAKPKFDPNLISSVQELARSTKIPLDRSRRSSSYSPKSKVVRAVEELFATEKQYHERLKHFALKKVPGKIAKPKKSLWQKFSAVIGLSTNANEYKPQLHTWPEIKKIAITQPNLGKFIGNLDEFVSNYTNPENDEKEVVYSTETVNKVKRSWKIIKNDLLEHHLSTHYQSYQFDKIINQPLIGPFPPALVKFEKFLKDNKENRARIDEEGPEFLITCLKNNLPSGWEALKEFLIKNNIWNDAIHKPCELFILNLHPFDEFINTSTSNSLPGGWERLKQLLNDNKLYSSEVIEHFEPFVSKYTGLAQSPHAFSEIDSLEDNKEYSHLTQQGVTDENICEWVDIIYDAVIGKPKEITIKDPITEEEKKVIRQGSKLEPIFKNMAVISVYYDHLLRLKNVISDNLDKNKSKLSEEDKAFIKISFGSQIKEYFDKSLIIVIQRIAVYAVTMKEIQKELALDHPAQIQLTQIIERLNQLGQMANGVSKHFTKFEDKINPENYRLDRPYSSYSQGNNYATITYMAKLGRLINCWHNDALGREVLLPREEKLDSEFQIAEIELDKAKAHFNALQNDKKAAAEARKLAREKLDSSTKNYERARQNSFAFKSIRAKIWERRSFEIQYVNEFQNFLQQLFVDSRQYFNDPITSRIDSKIGEIVNKIDNPQSIFANTLLNLKRQLRCEIQKYGLVTPHFPMDIFDDCFLTNIQSPTKFELISNNAREHSGLQQLQKQSSINVEVQSSNVNKLNIEDEGNARLAQHYMRLTIVNRVREIFQRFDQQTQHSLFKPVSDSIQRINYRIQQDLDELSKLSLEEYENKYNSRSYKEIIGENIINHIKPHLECAGILKESFLTGSFGDTLKEATDYLNHINQTKKTPHEMFVHNFLPVRDANQTTVFFNDDRSAQVRIFSLVWNLLVISDYYRRTGLGFLITQRAGIEPNNKLRHLNLMEKLAELTEKFALNAGIGKEIREDQAISLLTRLLAELKSEIIDCFPDAHNSRSVNELIHLYNHFIRGTQLEALEPRDERRFENYKLIVNYQASREDAEIYLNKHIAQKYAKAVLDYSLKIDSRFFVETAICKEETQKEILKIINDIYEMPVVICKTKIDALPELPRNVSNLIRYRINEYVQKSLSRKSIYEQGYLGAMLKTVNAIHEQFNPDLIISPAPSSISEISPLLREEVTSVPSTPRNKKLTTSMMGENDFAKSAITPARIKTPARTPAGKAARHKTVSVYSSLPLSFNHADFDELSLKKSSLALLVSQLLTLSHYYRNTAIGAEICKELHFVPNNKLGQSDFAKEIADSAMEIFLADEANLTIDINSRVNNSIAREKQLRDKMIIIINKIRGNGKGIENFTHSPDSRFAQALVELLPKDTPHAQHRNIKEPLPIGLIKGYKKNVNEAKHFIHQVAIHESYKHFEDLEEGLMGKIRKTAGDPQQIATHKIHLELKNLAAKSLNSCEAEIVALGNGKSIRDLIFHKISETIVRSGAIAECIFDGPFGNKLLNVANSLCNTHHTKLHGNFLRKVFTLNQVRRYQDPVSKLNANSAKQTKLAICGRLLMLSDLYLDKPLGRQVADKAALKSGNAATYNKKHKGWVAQAEIIKAVATGFYFGKHTDNEAVVSAIRDVLNHLKILIQEIRSSGKAGAHSRFVNELIRIVEDYGKEHGLNISIKEKINERYLFNNAKHMFNTQISSDNHEDYIHMHVIQNAAAELTKLKNEMNNQRWTPFAEKETLRIAEENLDKLYKAGIKERRDLIAALPRGQQDICVLIREKIKDKIPYSFWSPNVDLGQLQQPKQRINKYLNDIKQPQTSPLISSMKYR